jgi:hypothetical protein
VVESLPSKHKALSSNPRTAKKKKKEGEKDITTNTNEIQKILGEYFENLY